MLWCSPARPASHADITHARRLGLVRLLANGAAVEAPSRCRLRLSLGRRPSRRCLNAGHEWVRSRLGADPAALSARAQATLATQGSAMQRTSHVGNSASPNSRSRQYAQGSVMSHPSGQVRARSRRTNGTGEEPRSALYGASRISVMNHSDVLYETLNTLQRELYTLGRRAEGLVMRAEMLAIGCAQVELSGDPVVEKLHEWAAGLWRPASTRSAGCTVTTPDAVTPASDTAVPSPTRQHSTPHQLP